MSWYDALDIDIINDITEHQNNLDDLLTIINQLAMDKYDLGFNDGYDEGCDRGWDECYDIYEEEING